MAPTPNDAGPPAHDGAFGRAGFGGEGNDGNVPNRVAARENVVLAAAATTPAVTVVAASGPTTVVRTCGAAIGSRVTGTGDTPRARAHTSTAQRATSGCKYRADTI